MAKGKPKGSKKTGGRQKGSMNKVTREIKVAIEETFEKLGGVEHMVKWARERPDLFYTQVLPKVLPLQVSAKVDGEIKSTVDLSIVPSELLVQLKQRNAENIG
jgi:hypothetical protein